MDLEDDHKLLRGLGTKVPKKTPGLSLHEDREALGGFPAYGYRLVFSSAWTEPLVARYALTGKETLRDEDARKYVVYHGHFDGWVVKPKGIWRRSHGKVVVYLEEGQGVLHDFNENESFARNELCFTQKEVLTHYKAKVEYFRSYLDSQVNQLLHKMDDLGQQAKSLVQARQRLQGGANDFSVRVQMNMHKRSG